MLDHEPHEVFHYCCTAACGRQGEVYLELRLIMFMLKLLQACLPVCFLFCNVFAPRGAAEAECDYVCGSAVVVLWFAHL